MKLFFFLFCFLFASLSFSQTWDPNFYDKQILYDNADLLQLTEYEKLKLKSQELERRRNLSTDNFDSHYFDNPIIEYIKPADYNVTSDKVTFNYLFSNIVNQVSESVISSNVVSQNMLFFLDF